MRIGDLSQMAGTTARAIRHYHRAGVLPEPERSANGYRRYELADLVRVTRIRWLLAGGLSLREVSAVIDEEAAAGMDMEEELRAALDRVLQERARLEQQERVLRDLLTRVGGGRGISAVADDVLHGLDALARATGPYTRDLLTSERAAVELLAHRGLAGEQAQQALGVAYQRIASDPTLAAELGELAVRLQDLSGADPTTVAGEINTAATLLDSVLNGVGIEEFFTALGAKRTDPADGDDDLWLTTLFPDPAHRAVMHQVLTRRTT